MLPQLPPPPNPNVPAPSNVLLGQSNAQVIALFSQLIQHFAPQLPTNSIQSSPAVQQPQIVPNFAAFPQNPLPAPSNPVPPICQTAAQSQSQIAPNDYAQRNPLALDSAKELLAKYTALLQQQLQNSSQSQPIPSARPTKTTATTAPQPSLQQQQSQNNNVPVPPVRQMAQTSAVHQPQIVSNFAALPPSQIQQKPPSSTLPSSLFPSSSASARPTKTAKRRKLKVKAVGTNTQQGVSSSNVVAAPVNLQRQNLNNNSVHYCGPTKFFHNFNIRPSAKRILLYWEVPALPIPTTGEYKIHLVVTTESEQFEAGTYGGRKRKGQQLDVVLGRFYASHVRQSQFNATPGSLYSIELSVENPKTNEIVIDERRTAKAVFSTEEMEKLMQMAIEFAGTEMHPFTHLYRCKPQSYWDAIGSTMEIYVKDNNGQAASPINQNIRGLFFMASLKQNGNMPDFSPFGNVRMAIQAECLLAPYWVNLYFSDFYCYNKSTHYVQLVVTLQNSEADNFCRQQKLPELDLFDNPFLRFSRSQQMYLVNKHKNVRVEIFYTENLERSEFGCFDTVQSRGDGGQGFTNAAQHNKHCLHCNLYPIVPAKVPPAPQPPVQFTPLPTETADAMVREAESAELVDSPSFDPAHEQSSGFFEEETFEESTETKENVDVSSTQCPDEVHSAEVKQSLEVNQTEDVQPYNPNMILGQFVNDTFYHSNSNPPISSIFASL